MTVVEVKLSRASGSSDKGLNTFPKLKSPRSIRRRSCDPPTRSNGRCRWAGGGAPAGGVDRRDYGASPGMCRRRGSGSGMPCVAGASLEVCERRVAFPHYVHASASKRRHDGLIYAPGGKDVMWRFIHHLAVSVLRTASVSRQIHQTESGHRGGGGGFSSGSQD